MSLTQEDVNDYARCSRPSPSTRGEDIEAVKEIIFDNRRTTIREIAHNVGI